MLGLRLLNKKHIYLTKCHFSFKIHKQFFQFRISKSLSENNHNSLIAPPPNWGSLVLGFYEYKVSPETGQNRHPVTLHMSIVV